MIRGGGALLALAALVYLVCLPALDRRDAARARLARETSALEAMKRLATEYRSLSLQSDQWLKAAGERPGDFRLFSRIDGLARKAGIKDHIGYMKPDTQTLENLPYDLARVKVRFKDVFLEDLVVFLTGIEDRSSGVGVSSFSLTRTGEDKKGFRLDAVMEIQALVPGGRP